tara:strand:+ start:393 stop:620 length:228 start_codon:yes stop_codon:yes gene_type:complete
MNSVDYQYQLERIDKALFTLLDERARIAAEFGKVPSLAIGDILARYDGVLNPSSMRRIAEAIDAAFTSTDQGNNQ